MTEKSSTDPTSREQGIALSQAALIAGIGLLIMVCVTPFAELYVMPKLMAKGDIAATVQNIGAHKGLFLAGIFAYLITFICDVVVAWALYFLLIPVNRSLSLLAAWLRLVYAVIAFVAVGKLVTIFRVLSSPKYLEAFGSVQLHAHVQLLLNSFYYEWGMGLLLFGIYLGLLSCLVYRSGYIPKTMGALLAIAALGWVIDSLGPYLYPNADLGFLMITFLGEVIFMLWLLVRGRKLEDPQGTALVQALTSPLSKPSTKMGSSK